MKPLLLLLAVIAMTLFAACGDDDDSSGESPSGTEDASETERPAPTTPAPATGECEPNTASPAAEGDLTWDAIVPAEIPAPDGWTVSDADGDAPLLAVNDGTAIVGTVELLQFEVPFAPSGSYEALEAWTNDFYQGVQVDREAVGLNIALDNPGAVSFGDFCGVAYGYTVTDDDKAVIERYAGRATFDAQKIYLVVALYDAAIAVEMGFQSAEVLAAYEPSLTPLVESLSVPAD